MEDTELLTTTFAAVVKAIEPTEENLEEAKASLDQLKALLPPGIDPEDTPDLLFVVANLAVAGIVNRNDDAMNIPTALRVYKNFEKKPVNIEHSRKVVVGYALKAGLSEFGTDRLISEQEALESGKPFNICVVAVLWKVVNRELCDHIVEASNPSHSDYKSLSYSFELGFKTFKVVSLPKGEINLAKTIRVVGPADPEFETWKKRLRVYKGNGVSPDNPEDRVYRLVPEDVMPLGQGIVESPAAAVRGIAVINEMPHHGTEESPEVEEPHEVEESRVASGLPSIPVAAEVLDFTSCREGFRLFGELAATFPIFSVSSITPTFTYDTAMNRDKELQALQEKIAKADKLEDFKEIATASQSIAQIIAQESVRLEEQKKAAEQRASEFEKAKQETAAAHEKLMKDFEEANKQIGEFKKQLEEVRAAQAQAETVRKFDERMTTIDSIFDFTADERKEVVADVKDFGGDWN